MWISVDDRMPTQRGFYLCLSDKPYSSWYIMDDNTDEYMDCIIYSFYTGTTFHAENVRWWAQVPPRPENWKRNHD